MGLNLGDVVKFNQSFGPQNILVGDVGTVVAVPKLDYSTYIVKMSSNKYKYAFLPMAYKKDLTFLKGLPEDFLNRPDIYVPTTINYLELISPAKKINIKIKLPKHVK